MGKPADEHVKFSSLSTLAEEQTRRFDGGSAEREAVV